MHLSSAKATPNVPVTGVVTAADTMGLFLRTSEKADCSAPRGSA
jgi:hypothetical protein